MNALIFYNNPGGHQQLSLVSDLYVGYMDVIKLGSSYQGGNVFYVDGTGQHGLIASTADLSPIKVWTDAINACLAYTSGIYDDWVLPDFTQLLLMRTRKAYIGTYTNNAYWSSTAFDATQAYWADFSNTNSGYWDKTNTQYVRAIRSF